MIEPDFLARAIAELEAGAGVTASLQILRLLQRTYPVDGLSVEAYAAELEPLTHAEACFVAACAKAQIGICYASLQHVRRELAQVDSMRPVEDAHSPETEPAPDPEDWNDGR